MSFTRFPNLPVELQLQIWYHAVPLFPRIIEVRARQIRPQIANAGPRFRWPITFAVKVTMPFTLLQVNSEAQTELLRLYSPDFGTPTSIDLPSPRHKIESLLVNWEVDTLFFNGGNSVMSPRTDIFTKLEKVFVTLASKVATGVVSLAGTCHFWQPSIRRPNEVLRVDPPFLSLRQAIIVLDDERYRVFKDQSLELGRFVGLDDIEELQKLERLELQPSFLRAGVGEELKRRSAPMDQGFRYCRPLIKYD